MDSVESMLEAKLQGIHVSVTFEMIRLIIWQVPCSAKLQAFHISMTLSIHVLKVSNCHLQCDPFYTLAETQ